MQFMHNICCWKCFKSVIGTGNMQKLPGNITLFRWPRHKTCSITFLYLFGICTFRRTTSILSQRRHLSSLTGKGKFIITTLAIP